ncbi:MAG: hypothetical protein A3F84_18710 [Candidatus Handelsmanbacteria bacterium RIFCSPLOWO2_12_FULL_64_10]|uniref:Phosphoglycerate mutase n=1 Tax=Handelsmanbacteria sp. (strain RIFCSPLOWO2_12_FULL_64_10) TaxID=1817868 RepID=A0A1F6CC47_HANXR|nr:MAG: hypothetical protein A3F84_18710 [Candidatus Handelsmanbacteria bacterium RIFCSPLOWO2_12_FULL_64_10]
MTRVILVRHGATEWNRSHRFQGHQDVPLATLGRQQAERVAARLQQERVTFAFASDLQRARETAETVTAAGDIPLQVTPELRETSFGLWEGLTAKEIGAAYPDEWKAWTENPVATCPPKGESLREVTDRVVGFFDRALSGLPAAFDPQQHGRRHRRPTVLFVSHGGVLRALLTHLLDVPTERYWRFALRPGSISILDLYPEGAIAAVIGETSHLDGLRR